MEKEEYFSPGWLHRNPILLEKDRYKVFCIVRPIDGDLAQDAIQQAHLAALKKRRIEFTYHAFKHYKHEKAKNKPADEDYEETFRQILCLDEAAQKDVVALEEAKVFNYVLVVAKSYLL